MPETDPDFYRLEFMPPIESSRGEQDGLVSGVPESSVENLEAAAIIGPMARLQPVIDHNYAASQMSFQQMYDESYLSMRSNAFRLHPVLRERELNPTMTTDQSVMMQQQLQQQASTQYFQLNAFLFPQEPRVQLDEQLIHAAQIASRMAPEPRQSFVSAS
jgi:hypothetical protein